MIKVFCLITLNIPPVEIIAITLSGRIKKGIQTELEIYYTLFSLAMT